MKKIIGSFLLWILGWKVKLEGNASNLDRCILIVAPHTANLEFILGCLAYWKLGKPLKVIIKDQHTKAWYGSLVKAVGGVGIDRSQKNNLVKFVEDQFKKEDFSLVITPEGTRSWVPKWRLGFYQMALAAQVPIVFGSGDFKDKTVYLGKRISIEDINTRSLESIMDEIEKYYAQRTPKHPEKWNPKIY